MKDDDLYANTSIGLTMPKPPFYNTIIKHVGSTKLDSTFPTSNLFGIIILTPITESHQEAVAIILTTYPDNIYFGRYKYSVGNWQWGDISINYS